MALIVTAVGGVAGCQSGEHHPGPTLAAKHSAAPTTPTPSPTTDKEAIMTVYREVYRAGPLAERAQPEERRAILKPVATQPLLGTMLKGIAALRAQGRVTWGQPDFHIFEVDIRDDGALLRDCQDARKAGQADDRTGKRGSWLPWPFGVWPDGALLAPTSPVGEERAGVRRAVDGRVAVGWSAAGPVMVVPVLAVSAVLAARGAEKWDMAKLPKGVVG
ncbi:hypothetical protein [Nonomuraea diastatica]|uniref:Uncharacterized protein n=1 Tax=Nonomuraea diastatica TaxID=1848329 RepID=A0A4R4WB35_9ACTN|nr:hypothetical protein [Nonomuraea diastatica]TDD16058.1 hypothetical protein E1294_32620 [Nonomuraea diastatica]